MTKLEAVQELAELDHAIITIEKAHDLAEPFDLPVNEMPIRNFKTNPDANNGKGVFMEKEGHAVAAHALAEAIADHLKVSYPSQMGIGSRLRVACAAIKKSLEN